MTSRLPFLSQIFLAIFLLSVPSLLAQNNPAGHLTGHAMRAPLDVQAGKTSIQLCDLTPGETYVVKAIAMSEKQAASFEILPVAGRQNLADRQEKKDVLLFVAPATCVEIPVQATALQRVSSIPMYLSVYCASCENSFQEKLQQAAELAVLQVTSGISATDLIVNNLIGGDCYGVSNVTYSGQAGQIGTFSNGTTNIGFSNGIILATGNISVAPGPNNQNNSSAGYGIPTPDPELNALAGGSIVDRANIEFDFTPTTSQVSFEYVFASEEYCEYISSNFNDVFGFFISGPGITGTKNLAVIGANTPISISTINHLTNSSLYTHNTPIFGINCGIVPAFGPAVNEVEYDGFTKKLTAVVDVQPCQTYHIKLKIADVGDGIYDSAVFLRANSFSAGGSVAAETEYPNGQSFAYENCDTGFIRFARSNGDLTSSLPVTFTVSTASTATAGIDYAPLSSPVTIPAGQTEVLVPVVVFGDQLTEGDENIVILVNNSCSCTQAQVKFTIKDKVELNVDLGDQTICSGSSATLTPIITGGAPPLSFQWSTGATTASITVNPTSTTSYNLTVSDACGSAVRTAKVQVLAIVQTSRTYTFCAGDSVVLGGMVYTASDTLSQVLPGLNGSCDTLATYIFQVNQQVLLNDTIVFCAGDTVQIAGHLYTGSGIVQFTFSGTNGSCDTLATYVLEMLLRPAFTQTITFCPGDSVTINGLSYSEPDTIISQLPAVTGCDTLATYILEYAPQPTRTDTINFCAGDSIKLQGMIYTQPATIVVNLPASVGCDTLATYVLQHFAPDNPTEVLIECPESITVVATTNALFMPVTYAQPMATSDCACPGIDVHLEQGLPSGSDFPVGSTKNCYAAIDSCGNLATCCFSVSVVESSPCDIKEINCIKFELLSITEDVKKRKTYRIRTTNNCSDRLIYLAIQMPNGVTADLPANNSIYTAPGGFTYLVRNPNYSPFYSIRYASVSDSLQNGESDVFKYTLPAQVSPNYIHVMVRLEPNIYYEAHLNTYYCEVGYDPSVTEGRPADRSAASPVAGDDFRLFPNPTDGTLYADLSNWAGQQVQLRMYSAQGRLLKSQPVQAGEQAQALDLPAEMANGLYFLEVSPAQGRSSTQKFSVGH